jgi:hypothetical protein
MNFFNKLALRAVSFPGATIRHSLPLGNRFAIGSLTPGATPIFFDVILGLRS